METNRQQPIVRVCGELNSMLAPAHADDFPFGPVGMSKKLPYFTFYANDFWTSDDVMLMTPAARGAYIMILCKSWMSSSPGVFDPDDAKFAMWAMMPLDQWLEVKDMVLRAFDRDADGNYIQPVLVQCFKDANKMQESRAKGGVAKAKSVSSDAPAMLQQCSSNAPAMLDKVVTEQNRTEQNKTEQMNEQKSFIHSNVEVIKAGDADKDRVAFERDLARWKGSGGTMLTISEWQFFERMAMPYLPTINIHGKDEPTYQVACKAVSVAIEAQSTFGIARNAAEYIKAILERSRRDGVWPGEFAEKAPKKRIDPDAKAAEAARRW